MYFLSRRHYSRMLHVDMLKVTRCTNIAAVKVSEVTELIHKALDSDAAARVSGHVGMVTSTSDITAAAASVKVSHTETIDMDAAKETATMMLNASASDDESSSSSVVHLVSVPAAAVIDSGTSLCLHLSLMIWPANVQFSLTVTG